MLPRSLHPLQLMHRPSLVLLCSPLLLRDFCVRLFAEKPNLIGQPFQSHEIELLRCSQQQARITSCLALPCLALPEWPAMLLVSRVGLLQGLPCQDMRILQYRCLPPSGHWVPGSGRPARSRKLKAIMQSWMDMEGILLGILRYFSRWAVSY